MLGTAAERFPTRPFIVTPELTLTFDEAERQSRLLAKRLLRSGVGKGTRVGLLFPQGADFVVALLGIGRIGALAVPLSTFYRGPELRKIVRHTDLDTLLVPPVLLGDAVAELLESVFPGLATTSSPELFLPEAPYLRRIWTCGPNGRVWATEMPGLTEDGDGTGIDDALVAEVEAEVRPSDPMVMILTSGATAEPKAVVHTHGAQVRHSAALARLYGFTNDVRTFTTMPFFWVGGLTVTLLTHLHVGGTVITVDRMDGPQILEMIDRSDANRLVGWTLLERLSADPELAGQDLDWLSDLQLPGQRHPGRRHNSLGMTETGGPHTAAPAALSDVELPPALQGSFGPPVPGVEHRIIDPVTGATLPDGEEGEICVRGYSLMETMYKRERQAVFDEDGWYRTGDRGRFVDGLLFFTGRQSGMIKAAGANVSPGEVEEALQAFPGVKAAFVVGLPDADRGEIVGCLVCPQADHVLDPDTILQHLRGELSSYKVPRRLLIVDYDDVPWLPSGKVSLPAVIERLSS